MNKKDIKSGDLLQVPILSNLGFCVVKIIFAEEVLGKDAEGQDTLLFIYNYISKNEIKEEDINKALSSSLLVSPLLLSGLPRLRGKNKIKFLRNDSKNNNDIFIPDYKGGRTIMTMNSTEDPNDIWWYIKNLEFNNTIIASYDKVAHLEAGVIYDYDLILFRITLEFIRRLNLNVHDFYKIEDLHFFDISMYNRFINTPPYWSLSDEMKGKVLP